MSYAEENLPNSITHLATWGPIQPEYLPESLTHLYIFGKLGKSVSYLPPSLKYLSVDGKAQFLEDIPHSVVELRVPPPFGGEVLAKSVSVIEERFYAQDFIKMSTRSVTPK